MPDRLPAVLSLVDHHAIPVLRDAFPTNDLTDRPVNRGEERTVRVGGHAQSLDMFSGNDEEMNRRLGIDVSKGDDVVVLKNDVGLDFASCNFTKNAVAHDPISAPF